MIKLRKTALRERWEDLFWFEDAMKKLDEQSQNAVKDKIDRMKQRIRKDSRKGVDRLVKPITEEWRCVNHRDGEGYTEARIFTGNWSDMTDEEIDDLVREREIRISYPWDCTGLPFTVCLEWKRIPIGISVVHSVGLDV